MKTRALTLILILGTVLAASAAEAPVQAPEGSTITVSGELVYPSPPDKPRIRFVKSLHTMRDLSGKKRGLFAKLLALLAGGEADLPLVARPYGVWKQGDKLYVSDTTAPALTILDLKKATVTDIGKKGEGQLSSPVGVTVDADGAIYVTDTGDHSVKAYSKEGKIRWQKVSLGEAGGKLNRPGGISLTPTGELLVLDTGNKRGVLLSKDGAFIKEMCRNMKDPFALPVPANVWVEKNGDFIISDPLSARVHIFNSTGGYVSGFGEQGDSAGYLARPRGAATDSDGHIYVVDAVFSRVQIFNRQGELFLDFASPGQGPGELSLPAGIFIDSDDMIYIVDSKNQRIQVYQYLKYLEEKSP